MIDPILTTWIKYIPRKAARIQMKANACETNRSLTSFVDEVNPNIMSVPVIDKSIDVTVLLRLHMSGNPT